MNILFLVGKYPGFGGVETVTTVLANEFVKLGDRVAIASFECTDEKAIADGRLDSKVRLIRLSYPVDSKENRIILKRFVAESECDVVINQWAVPYYVTRFLKKVVSGTTAKIVAVHHNQPDTNARIQQNIIDLASSCGLRRVMLRIKGSVVRSVSRISLRYVYNHSDRFVVLSDAFVPLLERFIRKEATSRVAVIPNPLTIDMDPLPQQKRNEIVMVGRIEFNQKRNLRALDLWERIAGSFPDWTLTFVGDGPDRKTLELEACRRNLERVSFTGFVDPTPYYRRAKVLLMTSEYEGFGLVILEGMAHGVVPVVLDSYPALSDIVSDSVDGLKLPYPFDPDRSADILSNLLSSPERLDRISSAAIEVPARFSMQSVMDKWRSLLKQL